MLSPRKTLETSLLKNSPEMRERPQNENASRKVMKRDKLNVAPGNSISNW